MRDAHLRRRAWRAIRHALGSQSGATMVEYALLLALVALVAVVAVRVLGMSTSSTFQAAAGEVAGSGTGAGNGNGKGAGI